MAEHARGAKMFGHLTAGARPRARPASAPGYLVATAFHLAVALLLLRATHHPPVAIEQAAREMAEIFLEAELLYPETRGEPVAAGGAASATSADERPADPQELPFEIPAVAARLAPMPAPAPGRSEERTGDAEGWGVGAGLVLDSIAAPIEVLVSFDFEVTERVRLPRLRNREYVMELLLRYFPPRVANRHRTHESRIRFVIDARGVVDPTSIRLVAADRSEFAVATLAVAERLRFYPARHGRQAVPILIEMPFRWRSE